MCGIAGVWAGRGISREFEPGGIVKEMVGHLRHRGPDGKGFWSGVDESLALGHSRLAVIDLSEGGSQPMISPSGRFVMVFNGEIYGFQNLRKILDEEAAGIEWSGDSDTEVLLAAFDQWGVERTLEKVGGMFALAVWDCRAKSLLLARDRLGEKPLYYGFENGCFFFASELQAILKVGLVEGQVDRGSLSLFLKYSYVPSPYSIIKNVRKLPAGTHLTIEDLPKRDLDELAPTTFWSLGSEISADQIGREGASDEDAIGSLDKVLRESIRGQMVSDAPLGAFLSGGIDSSTIVSLMQSESTRPVETFTIGFGDSGYDESAAASAVARHLGTNHNELYLKPSDALDIIPRIPEIFDEPFADASQLPTFLVCQYARQKVTVALSGDGGDELFGGYNRHYLVPRLQQSLRMVPMSLRRVLAQVLMAVHPKYWTGLVRVLGKMGLTGLDPSLAGNRIGKLAPLIGLSSPTDMYQRLVSHWQNPSEIVIGGSEPPVLVDQPECWPDLATFSEQMMAVDMLTYLQDDILTKVDRSSMAVSLEVRVPFLDRQVVEFSRHLDVKFKIRDGQQKWILRQLLSRYVPKDLCEGPKSGFGFPVERWLTGPLREWAENLLSERRIRADGFFEPGPIREKWAEHLSGRFNWSFHIWNVLMFQAWYDEYREHLSLK